MSWHSPLPVLPPINRPEASRSVPVKDPVRPLWVVRVPVSRPDASRYWVLLVEPLAARVSAVPAKRKPLDPEAPARFLAEAAKARETVHATPGLGSDHRLRFRWGYGAALRVEETIVHLALFGGRGLGQGSHPSEPPLRRRRRVIE